MHNIADLINNFTTINDHHQVKSKEKFKPKTPNGDDIIADVSPVALWLYQQSAQRWEEQVTKVRKMPKISSKLN